MAEQLELGERTEHRLGLVGRAGEGGERVAPVADGAQDRAQPRLEVGRRGRLVRRIGPDADHGVEDVPSVADQRRAVAQQRVRAARAPGGDRAGHGAEVAAEVSSDLGRDQRPGALRRLDDDGHLAERGDDAVAGGEAPAERLEAGREL